jgi:hypothetical protein
MQPAPNYSENAHLRSIAAEITCKSSTLILKVVEGPILSNKTITINAAGIVGGKRSDGCTYFGQSDNVTI